tara:strand:+ start:1753 stop:2262 length:510 start_codon:yes stop_codon:yes gene_type:complete
MSKRLLIKYLSDLKKVELEKQLIDLYVRFPVVKEYYDFVFNPKEDKLLQEAKTKISNEYFPIKRKRPKARRSVAQKYIKHFQKLGVEPHIIAEVMLFNLEVAQTYATNRNLPDAFFKSMLNSFNEAIHYVSVNGLLADFKERIATFYTTTQTRNWCYAEGFSMALDQID